MLGLVVAVGQLAVSRCASVGQSGDTGGQQASLRKVGSQGPRSEYHGPASI